jgi:PPP family 3-phenylpropionic acid transporter
MPVPRGLRPLFLAIGTWTSAIAPFTAVILQSRGVDTSAIGVLAAVAALAATALVPAWGHLADVVVGRAHAFQLATAIAAVAAVLLVLPLPLAVLVPILASFSIFPALFQALGDSLAVDALPAPERQYGVMRALASLTFAIGIVITGFVYDRTGYAAAPLACLGWSVLLLLVLRRVPDRTRDPRGRSIAAEHGGPDAAGRFGSVSRALSTQPRLWGVLALFTVAYTGLMAATLFVGIRIVELGGEPSDVALTFGVSALAEVPGLIVAGWFVRHIGIRWLVVASLVGFGLCVVSWGVLSTPDAINVTRLLTGLCFGALIAARVVVIARLLPDELQATGQTMLQAATFGLGSALGAVIGGVVYGEFGPTVFFGLAGAVAIGSGIAAAVVLRGPVGDRSATPGDVAPVPAGG